MQQFRCSFRSRLARNLAAGSLVLAGILSAAPLPAAAQTAGSPLAIITLDLDAPDGSAPAGSNPASSPMVTSGPTVKPLVSQTPALPVQKVVNGGFAIAVDNGWVVYAGLGNSPSVSFYDTALNGGFNQTSSIKLATGQASPSNGGPTFSVGGIVFAPTPGSNFGLAFGEVLANGGGAGASEGPWFNDANQKAVLSDPNLATPGSMTAAAVDPTSGAFTVGYDQSPSGALQAFVQKLNVAAGTYDPLGGINLGTLGGPTSQALGISKNAAFVVGAADVAVNKPHAAIAALGATAWADISLSFPRTVLKSRALVASNAGMIAGTADVKASVAGRKNISVTERFAYNVPTGNVTFFNDIANGANVVPLRVLDNGDVIGNLVFVTAKGTANNVLPVDHPFLFDGTNLIDFGTLTDPATGNPAYSCRVSHVNSLGEAVGSCTANPTDTFGFAFGAFYLNMTATSPALVNLNTIVHAREDAAMPQIQPYTITNASWIDDEDEVTVLGLKIVGGTANRAAFLLAKGAYQ